MLDGLYDQGVALPEVFAVWLEEVEVSINIALERKDPSLVFAFMRQIRQGFQAQGLALAKTLYLLNERWADFDLGGSEKFTDTITAELGLSSQTVKKYIALWENVFLSWCIPGHVKEKLQVKPIGGLLLLTALGKDEDVPKETWEEIGNAPDKKTIREIVREYRGVATSSESSVSILIDNDGTLKAKLGSDGVFKTFGRLNLGLEDKEIRVAITRIITEADIVQL